MKFDTTYIKTHKQHVLRHKLLDPVGINSDALGINSKVLVGNSNAKGKI